MKDKPGDFNRYRLGYVIEDRGIAVRFPAEATHWSRHHRGSRPALEPTLPQRVPEALSSRLRIRGATLPFTHTFLWLGVLLSTSIILRFRHMQYAKDAFTDAELLF
jgi:hypothetical protein